MDYEKKLALAKEALDSGSYDKETIEYIFPELKESEDERMRKEILEFVTIVADSKSNKMEWIAWLEKQAPKPKWSEEDSLMIDSIIDTMKWLEGKGATNMKIDWLKSIKQRMGGEE